MFSKFLILLLRDGEAVTSIVIQPIEGCLVQTMLNIEMKNCSMKRILEPKRLFFGKKQYICGQISISQQET